MAVDTLRGHPDQTGPTTAEELVRLTSLPRKLIEVAVARLEGEGVALRGRFDPTPAIRANTIEFVDGLPGPVSPPARGAVGSSPV
ncbi:MAG TPA: hypothetical protein VMV23_08010 [Candidatus Nanopelagicaceae bacterium]|nr:hypothetical protein [Candidatus Nanopelagicaceae bacterium]